MSEYRPQVICISGFDPSGGAGILADIKTLEMHRVQGLGVCTALTFQNENTFSGMEWVGEKNIQNQLDTLLELYRPKAIKIGIIENLPVLNELIDRIKSQISEARIIWDPILKASAGFDFHTSIHQELLQSILTRIDLLTPNLPESQQLFKTTDPEQIANFTSCPVLLKGGHADSKLSVDVLIDHGEKYFFQHEKKNGFSKHGTGCILSSAIAANLAWGKELSESCRNAKEYIQSILKSNKTQLAYHYE